MSTREDFRFPSNVIIEACVETIEEALHAEMKGADQIELCSDLNLEGLTPSKTLCKEVFARITIPVKIMIRCRAGNFHYNEKEIELMADQIRSFSGLPVSGFVVGALDQDLLPDIYALEIWGNTASGVDLCFHKAMDLVSDWRKALDILSRIPSVRSILTSGLAANAQEGISTLAAMHMEYGDRFQIIAAGSITPDIVPMLHQNWEGNAYHGRRILENLAG